MGFCVRLLHFLPGELLGQREEWLELDAGLASAGL